MRTATAQVLRFPHLQEKRRAAFCRNQDAHAPMLRACPEPTRETLPGLENKRFGAIADAKCDWRVNFRGMWGHVRLRRDTSM